nr:zinc finger, CCHC-type [Tanacetum cinerariifolium]
MMKNVFGLRWNCRELKGIVKLRFFRNMGFNESGEYKKTFIGAGVGTGSMQVLHRFEFEVKPLGDHTFEMEPQENINQGAGLQKEDSNGATFAVAAVEKIYAHDLLTFNNTVACEMIWFFYGCKAEIWATKGLLDKAKENVLGHSILPLEGSLSGDCDVKKNGKWSCIYTVGSQEYQMVGTRLDIASADVGMLDKFNRGLQTDVQVFVDFDYVMGRSITIMAGYMTFTDAWKKEIWLKGLLTESRYELRLVAGIATGCLDEGGTWTQVTTLLRVAECWIDQEEVFVVWFFWKEQEDYILFGLPGSRQQKFLVLRFFDIKEHQGIDRLNIEKLDGNIVQMHGGSKQVGFKQLGPGVETGVHG